MDVSESQLREWEAEFEAAATNELILGGFPTPRPRAAADFVLGGLGDACDVNQYPCNAKRSSRTRAAPRRASWC
jgi:hypothetical protein